METCLNVVHRREAVVPLVEIGVGACLLLVLEILDALLVTLEVSLLVADAL